MKFNFQTLLIIGILLLAAFLRLYKIDEYMTFLGDEGRDALIVYDILHGKLTLLGPTASVGGFFLGPIYYYFMVPFLFLFNYNPVGPAIMVALFGIATVLLVYKVGSELFGKNTGLTAAFLYAISPLVISYSRSSWNPNLMPFFSLLSLYTIYKAVQKGSMWLFLISGLLLGIAMQLHYLTTFLGVIVAVYVLITKKTFLQVIKEYALILFGFLISWSPFLAFEARHDFVNIRSIFNFIFNSGETGGNNQFSSIIGNVFFRLFGRLVTKFPIPEQVSIQADLDIAVWYYATLTLATFSTILVLVKCCRVFVDRWISKKLSPDFLKYSLIFIWFSVGVGLFGLYKKSIYDYYFGFMFPLPFLIVGNMLSFLWTKKNILRIFSVLIFVGLSWINLNGFPFIYTPNRQMAQVKSISQFVLEKTDNRPFNFALITGGNSDHGYRYFFTLANKKPTIIQNEKIDPKRTTVTDQLLVVCEISPCKPLGHPLWEIAGFGRAEIVGEWNVSVVKVYKLVRYKGY